MSNWRVYIVQCNDGSLYTGVTTDLERRVKEHNSVGSVTRYTRSRQPVKLVYQEPADNRSAACSRESAIKRLSRMQKVMLMSTSKQTPLFDC